MQRETRVDPLVATGQPTDEPPGYRLLPFVAMLFVATLLTSTVLAVKPIIVLHATPTAGIIVFPLSYLFGDLLTEIYGYRKTRRVIWLGFGCLAMMTLFVWLGTALPPAPFWKEQEAFQKIFMFLPRFVLAGLCAYLVGEFLNAAVLSKLKVATDGRHFWLRCVACRCVIPWRPVEAPGYKRCVPLGMPILCAAAANRFIAGIGSRTYVLIQSMSTAAKRATSRSAT